jgi:hypothetical protein
MIALCLPRDKQRTYRLAAATAAATTAFALTVFTVIAIAAVVDHEQFVHEAHLLSLFKLKFVYVLKKKNMGLDHVEQNLGRFFFGCEFHHQLPTAVGHLVLIQRIKSLLAFLANIDEVCVAQNGEVMGNSGLGDVHLFDDLIDRKPAATALAHDLLAGVV